MIREIRVYTHTFNPQHGDWYTLLPGTTIEQFEALGIGDLPFTYSHDRERVSHCWECDRPIWKGQEFIVDEDEYEMRHEKCHWAALARREFETNLYKPRYVIAVYDCDRDMGGPEEGGWSYETGELVCKVEVDDPEAARMIQAGLEIEYPYTGKRGYYSKREPDYSVRLIDRHEPEVWHDLLDERLEPAPQYPLHIPYFC